MSWLVSGSKNHVGRDRGDGVGPSMCTGRIGSTVGITNKGGRRRHKLVKKKTLYKYTHGIYYLSYLYIDINRLTHLFKYILHTYFHTETHKQITCPIYT